MRTTNADGAGRRPGFILSRPGPDQGALDLRGDPDADLVTQVVREIRLRSFASVSVVVADRPGLAALASIARRLPAVSFAVTLRGCLPDAGPAAGLANVAVT